MLAASPTLGAQLPIENIPGMKFYGLWHYVTSRVFVYSQDIEINTKAGRDYYLCIKIFPYRSLKCFIPFKYY
jgi:hypothetical protein